MKNRRISVQNKEEYISNSMSSRIANRKSKVRFKNMKKNLYDIAKFDSELSKITADYIDTVIRERGFLAEIYFPIIDEEEPNEKSTD